MTPIRTTADDSAEGAEGTTYYLLGGEHVGAEMAAGLGEGGHTVRVVGESFDPAGDVESNESPTNVRALAEAGLGAASAVVVATGSDARNLLVAQLVRSHFEVPRIVVLVNDPRRFEVLEDAGHEPVCATAALSAALLERL